MPDIDRERADHYLVEIKESLAVLKDITTGSGVEGFVEDTMKVRAMKYTRSDEETAERPC